MKASSSTTLYQIKLIIIDYFSLTHANMYGMFCLEHDEHAAENRDGMRISY